MTKTVKAICVLLGIMCIVFTAVPKKDKTSVLAKEQPIQGVWAATLYSMDYPQKPTTDSDQLKKSAEKLIDDVKCHGFNTLFLQVRPSGDALYKSKIFPWSKYLTGALGTAPDNGFDPLLYIIDLAHKNNITVHAWINPYRITASEADNSDPYSIATKYPQLIVKHTDGKLYLNPGEPEAIQLVIDGALEIVKNYNIDGIHMDDYFYPSSAFPDGEAFSKYGGKFVDIGDWRRNNTETLVRRLGEEINACKKDVVFSVSPSGIWANKASNPLGSDTTGKQAFHDYYADTRLWVKENLVDWIIPQIYWESGHPLADFDAVSKWWNETVEGTNVKLCIGQGVYKAADEKNPDSVWYGESGIAELKSQLEEIKNLDNCHGFVQYRLGSITQNTDISNALKGEEQSTAKLFSDTSNYPWAESAIENLYKVGIVKGMGDGTFGCSRNVSRADFMVMLVRLTKQDVPFNENFADVTKDKYYYKEVGIAKVLGFAKGREGNIFDPTGLITREDMATLSYRVLRSLGKFPESSNLDLGKTFSDGNRISEYARNAVAILADRKILQGYETGEFLPKGNATRAECAAMLGKILSEL